LGEVDCLLWKQIKFGENIIKLEPNQYTVLKSKGSARDIYVDHEVMDLLRGFRNLANGEFVINAESPFKRVARYGHYRCKKEKNELIKWLRSKGITAHKPIHELRKEFGSWMTERAGIYVAQKQLGHSNIQTTASHYVDRKDRHSVGLGQLLKSSVIRSVPDQQAVSE